MRLRVTQIIHLANLLVAIAGWSCLLAVKVRSSFLLDSAALGSICTLPLWIINVLIIIFWVGGPYEILAAVALLISHINMLFNGGVIYWAVQVWGSELPDDLNPDLAFAGAVLMTFSIVLAYLLFNFHIGRAKSSSYASM
eukprot:TRINITY_DN10232_c0_g1_i1.p1 TRINITY_DN10232_c0_g1~~TRINITY_DN10232_c0_g1_i1.p1  ORF type:complete len:140 (-),score=8.59 TRINITY_DN10232_c0_g1_i1:93-512(-)